MGCKSVGAFSGEEPKEKHIYESRPKAFLSNVSNGAIPLSLSLQLDTEGFGLKFRRALYDWRNGQRACGQRARSARQCHG